MGESSGLPILRHWCLFSAGYVMPSHKNGASLGRRTPKLSAGAKVADIGLWSWFFDNSDGGVIPRSSFVGYDFHAPSIERPKRTLWRTASKIASVSRRKPAKAIVEDHFDLITMFDCLHDMGDPEVRSAHAYTSEA